MACPSDRNNGFVQITDAITQSAMDTISVKEAPFRISFAPSGTIPKLVGNRIQEDNPTGTTCMFGGNRFSLLDIQICSVLHKGYLLPTQSNRPEAELILTLKRDGSSADNAYSGMLLCFPLYRSNRSDHADYLLQILKDSIPSCKYEAKEGFEYTGSDYRTISDESLSNCINSCCKDNNCLAYNFKKGTCSLKRSIQEMKASTDGSIAGKVERTVPNPAAAAASCPTFSSSDGKKTSSSLQSIFFSSSDDQSQTSFSYKTCFEVVTSNNAFQSYNLAVFVFPRGIQLADASFEQMQLLLTFNFPMYQIPPIIRGYLPTLQTYRFGSTGNKTYQLGDESRNGIVYSTTISSCTNEFKNRFEYFTMPPKPPTLSNLELGASGQTNEGVTMIGGSSAPYTTEQYKCVPFNQLTDLQGSYVIPGNKNLSMILKEKNQILQKQNKGDVTTKSLTTDEIETYVVIGIGGLMFLALAIRGIMAIKNNGK